MTKQTQANKTAAAVLDAARAAYRAALAEAREADAYYAADRAEALDALAAADAAYRAAYRNALDADAALGVEGKVVKV